MSKLCIYKAITGGGPHCEGERFGIEVEAERWDPEVYTEYLHFLNGERDSPPEEIDEVTGQWVIIEDGSLRHNGIEFVSHVLARPDVPAAISALWRQVMETGLATPSVRTGIHVHCNAGHWTAHRLRKFLQFYLLAEPILFQKAGLGRWHNIYCIPLLLGKNEIDAIHAFVRALDNCDPESGEAGIELRRRRQQLNKYSALYIGPLGSHGTVEFRHAPTFEAAADMRQWMQMVDIVYRSVINCPADMSIPAVVAAMKDAFDPVFKVDWDAYAAAIDRYDAIGEALRFEPCTYKAKIEWGKPAGLQFDRTEARYPEEF